MQEAETGNILTMFTEAVRDFKENDFLRSTEPFDFANKVISEYPAYQAQLTEILAAQAKAAGVPKKVVYDALKQICKILPMEKSAVSSWDGQPFPIEVGSYILDGESIREQSGMVTLPVCSHPIMTAKRYIDIESGEESVEVRFRRDGKWRSVVVEKGLISDAGKIVPLSGKGISVTSENARALVRYLNYVDDKNRGVIPIERISTHVGWVGDNEFVPYSPGIQYGGPESFRQIFDCIREHGSEEKWLITVKAVRKEKGSVPARIALAASFASPLLIHLQALCFILHLWTARSGSGKTVTLMLAASVWGKPDVGDIVKSMKATTVAIELLAVFFRFLPLCLDELQTVQTRDSHDETIYMICEGHGKERGARNGGLRAAPSWRNVTITTGEMPIIGEASKAGSVNRVIEIEAQSDLLEDPRGVANSIQRNYGFAGRRFIGQLTPKKLEEARKLYEETVDRLRGLCTDKQALSAAAILVGDWLSEELIFHDGVRLTIEDILPYLKTDEDVDTNRRAHEWLLGWVSENYASFVKELNSGEDVPEQGYKALGKIENRRGGGRVAWINQKICKEAFQQAGYNFKSYFSWAKARGLLDRKDQKEYEYTPKISVRNDNKVRCVGVMIDKEIDEKKPEPVYDQKVPWE